MVVELHHYLSMRKPGQTYQILCCSLFKQVEMHCYSGDQAIQKDNSLCRIYSYMFKVVLHDEMNDEMNDKT